MKKTHFFIGLALLLITLWWTRYQPAGQLSIGPGGADATVVINRLTGRVKIITIHGQYAYPMKVDKWDLEYIRNQIRQKQ